VSGLALRGQPLHTRSLTIVLRQGEQGETLARGDVIDLRKTGFVPMPDGLQTAGIVHHMVIEARIGADRRLESLETAQPFVAIEPSAATRGECCRDPAPRLQALLGHRFDADFPRALSKTFGGALGCSHLLTLFHLLASLLPRALDAEHELLRETGARRAPGERFFRRSVFVDGHEPEVGALQLAVQLSDFHSAPFATARERIDHLALQHEVRVLADLDMARVSIAGLVARERARTRDTLASAPWRELSSRVAAFVGRPIMPGLGGALRAGLADQPDAHRLLDALLQLAPGFVQCTPALTDRLIAQLGQGPSGATPAPDRRVLPDFLALGGATDSCYMWRAGGPLVPIRPAAPDGDG
jgi:hypothetical protein